jgi:hypothetical protein
VEVSAEVASPEVRPPTPPAVDGEQLRQQKIELMQEYMKKIELAPGPMDGGVHSWAEVEAPSFVVRGGDYLRDRKKIASPASSCQLVHMQIFAAEEGRLENVAARPLSYTKLAAEQGDDRFFIVVVYQAPTRPFMHVVMYYALNDSPSFGKSPGGLVWRRFLEDDGDGSPYRTARWKVIPRVAEGPWLVRKSLGTKPGGAGAVVR